MASQPWPYVGQEVAKGDALFRLSPSVSSGRSLAELEADLEAAREESGSAESRLKRLEELIEVEATSQRELEEARTRAGVARARLTSAQRDLEAARAVREGRGGGTPLRIEAPFKGRVASIEATPGAGAGAAERLARVVRTDAVWLAVALSPHASSALSGGVSGLVLTGAVGGAVAEGRGDEAAGGSLRFGPDETRLVSVAPSVDPETGKLDALIEVPGQAVPLGSTWNAQVLLTAEDEGVVVPTSALVDDGGQTVVFLQLGGETFVRQPVEVEARQGDRALVAGLVSGPARGDARRRIDPSLHSDGNRRRTRPRPLKETKMTFLDRLIRFSLHHRLLVLSLGVLLLLGGTYWTSTMPVDIFPDLSAPTVTVIAEAPGMPPEEVELLVTFPLESAVNGATDVRRLRSVSADGISVLWVEFEWGTDIYKARQIVAERLQRVELPDAAERPELGPISSIMGEITFVALTLGPGRASRRWSFGGWRRPSCGETSSPFPASRRWSPSAARGASSRSPRDRPTSRAQRLPERRCSKPRATPGGARPPASTSMADRSTWSVRRAE